ncbi:MAG: UDP-N-acetylglucosamine 4,6-dehydratase (inverting) [Candidatus Omnitrophica bacterium]|nr:UDP-N-acetylglucosamine 4,6-dehydratase (inverting) [Candidatus Omnitrophota bacterium]
MKEIFKNKTVLVTGGTGSFGQKFAEVALKRYKPKKLIVFSRDEMKQFEMRRKFSSANIRYFIGDVRDPDRLNRALHDVDYIVHAAALKIVPSAEYNPFEVVKTNIIGAENVINTAIDNGIKKVIALSTDKAANPVNLYGATKLCAEKMFIAANNYSPYGTKFSVVRYGNVLGSRGSVVPFFKECRKKGKIPITDKRMTRFWVSLDAGVDFVISCIGEMKGGEVFVPKLPSMKIVDLARAIAPGCKIEVVGVRPGEKMHETLITKDDFRCTVEKRDRYITCPEVVFRRKKRVISGKLLDDSFEGYTSDKNDKWLTVAELKKLIR